MEQVKIIAIEHLTHDVLKIVAEKPASINYQPGQAVDISISKQNWEQELRAFTFTSLPDDEYIEFTIKTYSSRNGVTAQLLSLNKGDEMLIHDVFGDITYKGEGIFIAGGAGVTPFIAILKQLKKEDKVGNNKLIFANKTKADIILEDQFRQLLGNNFINILSDEKIANYEHGFISADLIKKHTNEHSQYFYLCGPEPMMQVVEKHLSSLGIADSFIVKEAF
ncbi:flavodoxin reductase [Agriterribacter sp.]|uniref:flavodoxin reductase n=1 Tax=Agriterribacter sp. TaxID=2821509 RepID=UPI002D0BBECD|nr:flavodoxin reductase [Agriterribacter sp.]HRO46986.1 flavodoxin reductase [Agriterribacter sp.]HRQ18459.1 flavodoxin reductase [Agriterribacter sp.]